MVVCVPDGIDIVCTIWWVGVGIIERKSALCVSVQYLQCTRFEGRNLRLTIFKLTLLD